MKKIIRLTESDLTRIVRRVIKETDKEKIIQGIVNGKRSEPRYSEYTAEAAMDEVRSHVWGMGCSEGKDRLLQDVSRFVDEAQKELSDEEFEKFQSEIDELVQMIDEDCSEDEYDEDDNF